MMQGSLPLPPYQLPPSSHSAWHRDSTSCLFHYFVFLVVDGAPDRPYFSSSCLYSSLLLPWFLAFFSRWFLAAERVGLPTQSSADAFSRYTSTTLMTKWETWNTVCGGMAGYWCRWRIYIYFLTLNIFLLGYHLMFSACVSVFSPFSLSFGHFRSAEVVWLSLKGSICGVKEHRKDWNLLWLSSQWTGLFNLLLGPRDATTM